MPSESYSGENIRSITQLDTVVDADSHVTESFEDILPYVDERYSGIKKIMSTTDRPYNDVFSMTFPSPGFNSLAERDPFSGMEKADDKLETMDEYDIDHSILDPTLTSELNNVNNSRFAVALANASNSYILDTFADEDDRFSVTISVAPQKPALAAEEIDDRANEDDVVGVHLPPAGLIPPPGHERYYPIYEAAQDHNLPIIMHTVTGCTHLTFPIQHQWTETFALEHAIFHPIQHMVNFSSIMFSGVPERFPDLTFIHQEAGIGWMAYMLMRLDDHYMDLSHELPGVEKMPSEYFDDQFYITTQPLGMTSRNPEHIAWMVDMVGPDSVMFSADLPHPDFDTPEELFNRIIGFFEADTVQSIMGRNAMEAYNLEI